ncbi:NUDIX domain-containing protein [Catenulispora yoronensis]
MLAAKLGHVYTRSLEHGAAPLPKAVHKPRPIWLAELPKVLLAAVMVCVDADGRVLLVHQPYSPANLKWSLPGGGAHDDEPPRVTARRECAEELALNIEPGELLCTDWMHATDRPPIITYAYDGGVLDEAQIARIQLTDGELSEYRFVTIEQAQAMMPDVHFRRLAAAMRARAGDGPCTDLQDGIDIAQVRAGAGRPV